MRGYILSKLADLEVRIILLEKGVNDLADAVNKLSEATADLSRMASELSSLTAEMAEKYGKRLKALEGKKDESV